jgi:hypothetical protein
MELPNRSLQKLVKTYTEQGHDPHIGMLELTKEQQDIIKQNCSEHPQAELVYIHLQRNISISSVFGTLNIETLKWIVNIKTSTRVASPTVQNSVMETLGPPSFSRISDMKSRFKRLIGARRRIDTLYSPPPDEDEARRFPVIPGENLCNPDLHQIRYVRRPQRHRHVFNGLATASSTPSISPPAERDTPPTLRTPSPEENGEDIVNELLLRWTNL